MNLSLRNISKKDEICEVQLDYVTDYSKGNTVFLDVHDENYIITKFLISPPELVETGQAIFECLEFDDDDYNRLKKLEREYKRKNRTQVPAVAPVEQQTEGLLDDVAIFQQLKGVLKLYNDEIMAVKNDDTLDDEQKEETIAQLKDLRDEHINKLRGR
jgi:hypothetical protein